MTQGKIKNLIFDFSGVVVFIDKPDFARLDTKFNLPTGTLERIVTLCSQQAITNKNFNERQFFEKQFSLLLHWHDYHHTLVEWFATERLNAWLVRLIERKRKKYRIVLLTNYTAGLAWRLEKKFRIANHFDYVFNSADLGITKPDPRIFRHLLRNIASTAQECLFVDDKKKNIDAAKKLGFKTILFKDNRRFSSQIKKFKL